MGQSHSKKYNIDLCENCAKTIGEAVKKGGQDNLVTAFRKLTHCPICKKHIPRELDHQLNANVLIIPPLPVK